MAGAKLPVSSLLQPISEGATIPLKFADAVMSAMAPAAAGPVKNDVGNVQKTGNPA